MFDNANTTTESTAAARQRYYRLVYAIVGVGILALLAGIVLDRQLAGTAIYLVCGWTGAAITFLAPAVSDVTLQDERDVELYNRAAGLTMGVLFVLGITFVPAAYVLEAAGHLSLDDELGGAILLASGLFLLWGLSYGIVKRRA